MMSKLKKQKTLSNIDNNHNNDEHKIEESYKCLDVLHIVYKHIASHIANEIYVNLTIDNNSVEIIGYKSKNDKNIGVEHHFKITQINTVYDPTVNLARDFRELLINNKYKSENGRIYNLIQ